MGRKKAGGAAVNVSCNLGGYGWADGGAGTPCGIGSGGQGQSVSFTSKFKILTMTAFVAGFGGDRGEYIDVEHEHFNGKYTVGGGGGGVLWYGVGAEAEDGSGLVKGTPTAGRGGKGFGAGGGAGGFNGNFGGDGAIGFVYVEWG